MSSDKTTEPRSPGASVGGRPEAAARPPALTAQDRRVLVTLRLWRAAAATTAGLPGGRYQVACPVCAALGQPENVLRIERAKGRLAGLGCAGWTAYSRLQQSGRDFPLRRAGAR